MISSIVQVSVNIFILDTTTLIFHFDWPSAVGFEIRFDVILGSACGISSTQALIVTRPHHSL